MQPGLAILTEKKLVGMKLTMTLADNQTFKLWQSFMPRRREIGNKLTTELFSMQVYPQNFHLWFK
jgi:AraC family transcriptional regulator